MKTYDLMNGGCMGTPLGLLIACKQKVVANVVRLARAQEKLSLRTSERKVGKYLKVALYGKAGHCVGRATLRHLGTVKHISCSEALPCPLRQNGVKHGGSDQQFLAVSLAVRTVPDWPHLPLYELTWTASDGRQYMLHSNRAQSDILLK
jgi:hypothetical protein